MYETSKDIHDPTEVITDGYFRKEKQLDHFSLLRAQSEFPSFRVGVACKLIRDIFYSP
jgi:hypothetical protein